MSTLVLPLDGSACAEQALPTALSFLKGPQDKLILVRVVPFPNSVPPHVLAQLVDELELEAALYLKEVGEPLRARGLRVDEHVRSGQPAREVAHVADKEGADLIVLSTHGRSGLQRWLLGSVAENVVRQAPCPVWLVRAGEEGSLPPAGLPEEPLVMVPLDGSRASERSLSFVRELLAGAPARLLLVGATDLPQLAFPLRTEVRHVLESYLRGKVTELPAPAEYLVVDGPAVAALQEVAQDRQPDLIVMANRQREGLDRWVLGSVAEHVLRHATGSVVIVPQHTRVALTS